MYLPTLRADCSTNNRNNVLRPSSVLQGVTRSFQSCRAAEQFAVKDLGAKDLPKTGKGTLAVLGMFGRIYDIKRRKFLPADLMDCCARHIADSDLFRMEPGAEFMSIMLKYAPVRVVFSHELRKVIRPGGSIDERAKHLWMALQATVLTVAQEKYAEALALWSRHWGRNVQHHSGWLAFLQRTHAIPLQLTCNQVTSLLTSVATKAHSALCIGQ